jgi:hypothetical protein
MFFGFFLLLIAILLYYTTNITFCRKAIIQDDEDYGVNMIHLYNKWKYKRGKLKIISAFVIFIVLLSLIAPVLHYDPHLGENPLEIAYERQIDVPQDPMDLQTNEIFPTGTRAPIDEFHLKYILGYGSMIGFLNSIKSADVDSDGVEEVVFGNKEGNIYVMDMSQIEPITEWISPILGGSTFGIGLGDVDDDSKIEIVCGSGDGIVRVFGHNNGDYELEWESPNLGQFAYGLEVGNTDSDPTLEIVVGTGEILFDYDTDGGWAAGTSFDPTDENLYVFGYDGSNIVQEWSTIVPALYDGTGIYNIAIGDTDGDSTNEIVIGTFEWELLSGDFEGRYGIYGYDGSSYSAEWAIRELGNWIMGIGVGDTDGDSDIEIVIAVWETAFYVYGYFIDPIDPPTYAPEYQSVSLSPFTLAVGDIDGDGEAEIMEAEGTETNIYDYEGGTYTLTGTIDFIYAQLTGLGVGNPDSVTPLDILVGEDSSFSAVSKTGVPLCIGDGLANTASIAAADVDRNGKNELYVLSRLRKITVLEMDGAKFKIKDTITIPSDFSLTNLLIDDFDNDGLLELCAIEGNTTIKYSGGWLIRGWGSSSTLYFIEYNGNNYDISQQVSIADNSVFSAESADFDGDNKVEVVVGGTHGDLVFVEYIGGSYVIDAIASFSDEGIICLDSGDTDSDGKIEIAMSNESGILKVIGHDGTDYSEEFSSSTNFPIALEIGSVDSDAQEEIFVKGGFTFDMNIFKWNGASYVEDAVLTDYDMVFDEALLVGGLVNKKVLVVNSFSSSLIEHDIGYSQIWESGTLGSNAQSSAIENVDGDASSDLIVAFKGNVFIYGTFGALTAVLSVSDNTVETGEQVIFDGSQSQGSGQLDYFFDFGDGTNTGWIASSQTAHSYSSAGTYIATLRVRDPSGTQSPNLDSKTIFVTAGSGKPTAIIDSISPNPAQAGDTISFAGHGTDDSQIVEYRWESSLNGFLDDGASFNYSGLFVGNHNISFSVKNDNGKWSDPASAQLRVNEIPIAKIDSITPSSPNEGDSIRFEGHGTDDDGIVGYNWRSSIKGFLSNSDSFSTQTLSAGIHMIYFKVLDSDGAWSKEVSKSLRINQYPIAKIESVSPSETQIGELVFFVGSGEDEGSISSYSWESSIDGFLSSKSQFSTATLSPGVHTISFMVEDNKGAESEPDTVTITVMEIPENIIPTAVIDSVNPSKIIEGEEVSFVGHGDDPDNKIKEYFWESDFDGILSNERSFSTNDLSVGTHIISFRVRDEAGDWSESEEVIVQVIEKEDDNFFSNLNFDLESFEKEPEMCLLYLFIAGIIIFITIIAFAQRRKRKRGH